MGMWDSLLNEGEYDPRLVDMAKAYIPIIGPLLAVGGVKSKQNKAMENWLTQNIAYNDPDELDEMGRRVQARMLSRTGGELSTPGLIAATAYPRAAKDPGNYGNVGNILSDVATKLGAAGQSGASMRVGAMAHKTQQAPWKSTDVAEKLKPINFTKNGEVKSVYNLEEAKALAADGWKYTGAAEQQKQWDFVTGNELGRLTGMPVSGDDARALYKIIRDEDGNPIDAQKLDNAQKLSIGGTNIVSPPDISGTVDAFTRATISTKELTTSTRNLRELVARNPVGGVQGWSGVLTGLAGRIMNMTDFVRGLGSDEKQLVDKYAGDITKYASKYFPTSDQALAESLTIQLAYHLARQNNMGNAGGGRGITDPDMKFALQQLATMSQPSDMLKVVEFQERRALEAYDLEYTGAKTKFAVNGMPFPAPLEDIYKQTRGPREEKKTRTFNIPSGGTLPDDLQIGDIVNGKRWNGGMVNDPNSWENP